MAGRGAVKGWLALLVALGAAAAAAGEEVYVGTATLPAGAKPASVHLTLTIRQFTSEDRALALAEVLQKRGHAGVVAEMAKDEAGTVRLGDKASFRATVITQQKTDAGRTVRVVTDHPMQLGDAKPAGTIPADAVGYLELQLGANGEGKGRILTAVKAGFDSEGFVAPESLGEAWTVSGVKRNP
jgi:membrane protein implicated in regulation of membrane protease activity